jgi:hypothetical protein
MMPDRFCPNCGRQRGEKDRFCSGCGREFEAADAEPRRSGVLPSNVHEAIYPHATPGEISPSGAPVWRVAQNPWLCAILVVLTFDLYTLWWFGRTWARIKREDGDQGKRPVWHALSMFVPIYGLFQFYGHMRTIRDLSRQPTGISPGAMTVAWIVVSGLSAVAGRPESSFWLTVMAALLGGALIGLAQAGLNIAWRSLPGGAVEDHIHARHVVVIVLGAIAWLLVLSAVLGGAATE